MSKHHAAVATAGDPKAERRFRRCFVTDPETGCWLWRASRNQRGYGRFNTGGGSVTAHRWSYMHFVGAIPADQYILHSCDTPACVNPDHLRPGTHLDNMRDRRERGRMPQQQRTHCPQGHPYSEDNTYMEPGPNGPVRKCRTCRRERTLLRMRAVREKARAARTAGAPPEELSVGQMDVLKLDSAGLRRGAIAARLGISVHAVDLRRGQILLKLRVRSKNEAVVRARELRLLPTVIETLEANRG